MENFVMRLWNYKPFRVFIWNTLNGIITLATTWLMAQSNPQLVVFAPFIMSGLSLLTKYLNNKYFNDLGVIKE